MSLFGDWGDEPAAGPSQGFDERIPIPDIEFEKGERLKAEKEMLGLYVSDHPLFGVEAALKRKVEHSLADLETLRRRRRGARRRCHHRARPQVHQARRPDGGLRARGSRVVDRGDRVPADVAGAGSQARGRRDRHRQGAARQARRVALRADRPGHPGDAGTLRRPGCAAAPGDCRAMRSTSSRSSGSSGSCATTRATRSS